MLQQFKLTSIAVALTFATGTVLDAPASEQFPATKHQADTLDGVNQKGSETTAKDGGMPMTEHQEDVLGLFDKADKNRDGMLSRDEYQTHMQNMQAAAARNYNDSLHDTERHGVDAGGPRDRVEAENRDKPVNPGQ